MCIYIIIICRVFRCIQMYSDVFRCIQMYSNVFKCIQMYSNSNVFKCIQMYSGVFRCIQVYSDVFRCIQMYSDVFKCIPISLKLLSLEIETFIFLTYKQHVTINNQKVDIDIDCSKEWF